MIAPAPVQDAGSGAAPDDADSTPQTLQSTATALSNYLQRTQIRQRQQAIADTINDFDAKFTTYYNGAGSGLDFHLAQSYMDLRNLAWTVLQAMDDTYSALLAPMVLSGLVVADDLGLFSKWLTGPVGMAVASGGGVLLGGMIETCPPKLNNNGLLALPGTYIIG